MVVYPRQPHGIQEPKLDAGRDDPQPRVVRPLRARQDPGSLSRAVTPASGRAPASRSCGPGFRCPARSSRRRRPRPVASRLASPASSPRRRRATAAWRAMSAPAKPASRRLEEPRRALASPRVDAAPASTTASGSPQRVLSRRIAAAWRSAPRSSASRSPGLARSRRRGQPRRARVSSPRMKPTWTKRSSARANGRHRSATALGPTGGSPE